eukprot:TRINITY_DN22930_c0_g1_i3.p1 TRINITY_DN22930_c0_g1~~TRINITY_DN22930_c0_g1_i3.p1  ORF type:complete len:125 (-),score=3.39 TRINITY_DN22930_c0_g1_i3:373-747(-)
MSADKTRARLRQIRAGIKNAKQSASPLVSPTRTQPVDASRSLGQVGSNQPKHLECHQLKQTCINLIKRARTPLPAQAGEAAGPDLWSRMGSYDRHLDPCNPPDNLAAWELPLWAEYCAVYGMSR